MMSLMAPNCQYLLDTFDFNEKLYAGKVGIYTNVVLLYWFLSSCFLLNTNNTVEEHMTKNS